MLSDAPDGTQSLKQLSDQYPNISICAERENETVNDLNEDEHILVMLAISDYRYKVFITTSISYAI